MIGGTPVTGISVVFATAGRTDVLAETLRDMGRLDRRGIDLELVIVDNNALGEAEAVIRTASLELPIRYLHEPVPGKNRALNRAVAAGGLKSLVLFTDDDVTPAEDWLQAVAAISRRWPAHGAFGGRIVPRLPFGALPGWTDDPLIRQFAFAAHDLGRHERAYPPTEQPFGPNFWVRREALATAEPFNEGLGPGTGTLGDEMMFLHALQRQGIEIMYSPHAAVEHRIQPQGVDSATVLRRAVEVGRVGPVMYGVCRPGLLRRFPLAWGLLRRLRLCLCHAALLRARLIRDEGTRVRRTIQPLIDLGYNREVLARARASRRKVSGPEQQPEILRVG